MSGKEPSGQTVEATGGSSIQNVLQMAIHLDFAGLVEELRALLIKYWPFLLAVAAVNSTLVGLYLSLRDRLLLNLPITVGMVVFATIAVAGWYARIGRGRSGYRLLGLNLSATLLLVGGMTWQAYAALRPPQFSPNEFGIAVSRFGEGAAFRGTPLALDITDQVTRGIQQVIQENGWEDVRVLPVGLVKTGEEAQALGRRVQADLVVWGQVVQVGSGAISVHYEISESLDRVTNPVFPVILPAESRFIQSGVAIPLEPEAIQRLVSEQGQLISAFILGLAASFNRDYAAAADQFERAAQAIGPPEDQNAQPGDTRFGLVAFYLGRSYQLLGKLEEGEHWLIQAGSQLPGDPAIPLSLAFGYNSLGRAEDVQRLARDTVDLATTWLTLHPDNPVVAYNRGLAYSLLEQHLRAATEFDAILEDHPEFYVAYLSSGRAYLAAGEANEAIERFETAIDLAERLGTDPSWGVLSLAVAYEEMGNFQQAEQYYQKAVELAPEVDWMHYRLGEFYAKHGQAGAAWQSYQRLIDVTYDQAWAHSVMGRFLKDQNLIPEAIREFEIVRRERVFDTLSQIYLAELYFLASQPEMSLQTYDEALARSPELQYGWASFGHTLATQGDYPEAIEAFKIALELDPLDMVTRFNLGRAYEVTGQSGAALAEYQSILETPAQLLSEEILFGAQERVGVIGGQQGSPTPTPTPTHTQATLPTVTVQPGTTPSPAAAGLLSPTPSQTTRPGSGVDIALTATPTNTSAVIEMTATPPFLPTHTFTQAPASLTQTPTYTRAPTRSPTATLPAPQGPNPTPKPAPATPTSTLPPPLTPTDTDIPSAATATLPPPLTPTDTDIPAPASPTPPPPQAPTSTDIPAPTTPPPPPESTEAPVPDPPTLPPPDPTASP